MTWKHLISQANAISHIGQDGVRFVDASVYLPAHNRNGLEEYQQVRIPGAVFFDIDAIADTSSDLPHMLPSQEVFSEAVGSLGIADDNLIIVYDGPGLFSAARAWWTFRAMGARNVKILEGGMDAWKAKGLPTETGVPIPLSAARFNADFNAYCVADMADLIKNLESHEATVLDARPLERFTGEAPEPRPGLRGGHIPASKSVPVSSLVEAGKLKPQAELAKLFSNLGIDAQSRLITSCGSGITAAIIALALDETGYQNVRLYDGSWAEWGMPDGPEIETGQ